MSYKLANCSRCQLRDAESSRTSHSGGNDFGKLEKQNVGIFDLFERLMIFVLIFMTLSICPVHEILVSNKVIEN